MSDAAQVAADMAAALVEARAHVQRQQHAGTHEQDREDARQWMDRWDRGRCGCEACQRDARRLTKAAEDAALRRASAPRG